MFKLAVQAGPLTTAPYIACLLKNNARQGFVDAAQFKAIHDGLPGYLGGAALFLRRFGRRPSEMRSLSRWSDVVRMHGSFDSGRPIQKTELPAPFLLAENYLP